MEFNNKDDLEKHVSFTLEAANIKDSKKPEYMKREDLDQKLIKMNNIENMVTKLMLYFGKTRDSVYTFAESTIL